VSPMPTKRTPLKRSHRRITQAAIEAWKACDYSGLHQALGLRPWEMSPLPEELTPLGCSAEPPTLNKNRLGDMWCASWHQAKELQRELMAIAGPPGRAVKPGNGSVYEAA
jgi:hypothetical protein